MVRGLGGGSPLEIRSGKGGVATSGQEAQRGNSKVLEVTSSFTAVAWLASDAPYHGMGEGYPHDTVWTVPRATVQCVSVTGWAFMC